MCSIKKHAYIQVCAEVDQFEKRFMVVSLNMCLDFLWLYAIYNTGEKSVNTCKTVLD